MALEAAQHTPFQVVQYPIVPDPPSPLPSHLSRAASRRTASRPRSRPRTPSHIPRPPNAFILFRSAFIRDQRVSSAVEASHSTLSKIIGLTWQRLSAEEREVWHERAREAAEEHRRRFPEYTFRPKVVKRAPVATGSPDQTAPAPQRRPKREFSTPDDPVRCAKIAGLLAAGTAGPALDQVMAEFDVARGPRAVEARFAQVVTATTFAETKGKGKDPTTTARRASSEPAVVPEMREEPRSRRPSSAGPEQQPRDIQAKFFDLASFTFPDSASSFKAPEPSSTQYPQLRPPSPNPLNPEYYPVSPTAEYGSQGFESTYYDPSECNYTYEYEYDSTLQPQNYGYYPDASGSGSAYDAYDSWSSLVEYASAIPGESMATYGGGQQYAYPGQVDDLRGYTSRAEGSTFA
ncbi:hypothetical protein C8F01DRAFT_1181327 [Mycena amicta]|nr:hypothetical protein C8F01DRAFT_1181327 [Mycena amicta]